MITLLVQDLREDDKFYHVECEPNSTVEDLKCLINIQSNVEVEKQELFFRQQMLTQDTKKLNDIGIVNNDMINMGITVLNSDEQDLMNAFFAAQPN